MLLHKTSTLHLCQPLLLNSQQSSIIQSSQFIVGLQNTSTIHNWTSYSTKLNTKLYNHKNIPSLKEQKHK